MRDLVAVALALFVSVLGIFYAYGSFSGSNTTSMVQETFLEVQQTRTELASYAASQSGPTALLFTPRPSSRRSKRCPG